MKLHIIIVFFSYVCLLIWYLISIPFYEKCEIIAGLIKLFLYQWAEKNLICSQCNIPFVFVIMNTFVVYKLH